MPSRIERFRIVLKAVSSNDDKLDFAKSVKTLLWIFSVQKQITIYYDLTLIRYEFIEETCSSIVLWCCPVYIESSASELDAINYEFDKRIKKNGKFSN